jgi:D-tyrosyl-tRNA(Tyr) deacylase
VGGDIVGEIHHGMLALVAAQVNDTQRDVDWMANRLHGLRMFEDPEGKMNLACAEVGGRFLVVSNFTVAGDTRAGRRPSFTDAAGFEAGKELFDSLIAEMRRLGADVQTGSYGEEMAVSLLNDGPITLIVESPRG